MELSQPRLKQARTRATWQGSRFDWTVAILSMWVVGGGYLDQWAHRHRADLESFFTPWHAVLYSGFAAVATYLVWNLVRGRSRGHAWWDALPAAYLWSMAGVALFMLGGIGDLVWHEVFGIEVGLEALVSPSHLLLAVAIGIIASGPLHACWQRGDRTLDLPGMLSAGVVLSVVAYFTVYAHPFVQLSGTTNSENSFGMTGILLHTLLLCGFVLLLLVRFQLVPGTLTVLIGLTALPLSLMEYTFIMFPVGLAAGAAGDILLRWLDPAPHRVVRFRLFAFSLPVLLWTGYFAVLLATGQIAWTVHLWTGAIVQAGIFGWLLSYLVIIPGGERWLRQRAV